jgi:hypothetical protein
MASQPTHSPTTTCGDTKDVVMLQALEVELSMIRVQAFNQQIFGEIPNLVAHRQFKHLTCAVSLIWRIFNVCEDTAVCASLKKVEARVLAEFTAIDIAMREQLRQTTRITM